MTTQSKIDQAYVSTIQNQDLQTADINEKKKDTNDRKITEQKICYSRKMKY